MNPAELSRQLRHGSGPFLTRRRGVAGLSLVAAGAMGLISLYQSSSAPPQVRRRSWGERGASPTSAARCCRMAQIARGERRQGASCRSWRARR